MPNNCHFCGDLIDQKLVLCMADDLSHAICRKAGKAVSKEERDADAARIAKLGSLPWAAYRMRSGEWSSSFYFGATRTVVLVGCDRPYGIPAEAVVYELPEGKTAEQVAEESGGIIVVVFDTHPRGEPWKAFPSPVPYSTGIKYRQGGPEEDSDIRVALVCAELREQGIAAHPYIRSRKTSTGHAYHCLILWPDGSITDPVAPCGGCAECGESDAVLRSRGHKIGCSRRQPR